MIFFGIIVYKKKEDPIYQFRKFRLDTDSDQLKDFVRDVDELDNKDGEYMGDYKVFTTEAEMRVAETKIEQLDWRCGKVKL